IKSEEQLMKCFDVIPCLYRDVVFTLRGISFQCFAVCQNVNSALYRFQLLKAPVQGKAANNRTCHNEEYCEASYLAECCINIFGLPEHGCDIIFQEFPFSLSPIRPEEGSCLSLK